MKYVSETNAGKSVAAYVILNKKGEYVAKVQAIWTNGGTCLVNVFCNRDGFQFAKAGGYGYDKFNSALSGMTIDGHQMTDHCARDNAPKPPKGRKTFPRDYKCPKGYSLANWTSVSKATGLGMHSYTFRDMAEKECSLDNKPRMEWTDEEWTRVSELADRLEKDWRASDDCEVGYKDCYRESGLKYLEAIGYRVFRAI